MTTYTINNSNKNGDKAGINVYSYYPVNIFGNGKIGAEKFGYTIRSEEKTKRGTFKYISGRDGFATREAAEKAAIEYMESAE